MTYNTSPPSLPNAFLSRRWQSLMGLWLVFYLIFHLLANSQAALLLGENGKGFVKAANDIRELPFLPVLEIVLLAIPFAIHIIWGIQRLRMAKYNSSPTDGSSPSLEEYPRNHAYTWQRITSWLLLFLIAGHVIHMRFIEQPATTQEGRETYYMVRLDHDPGIESLSQRIGAVLYNEDRVKQETRKNWLDALKKRPIHANQYIAVANNFGTAELLMIRETFKNPALIFFYTVLVISACFHAFNGLWTACITWGLTLSPQSQRRMRWFSTVLMALIAFLGLSAIWGTYWINLRQ